MVVQITPNRAVYRLMWAAMIVQAMPLMVIKMPITPLMRQEIRLFLTLRIP